MNTADKNNLLNKYKIIILYNYNDHPNETDKHLYTEPALVMQDALTKKDIAVDVVGVYKNLEKKGWQKIYKGPKDTPLTHDVFEAHNNWNFSSYNPTLEDLLTRATEFDNILFASIEDVKKWKQGYNRLKDISDIELIDNYLKIQKV